MNNDGLLTVSGLIIIPWAPMAYTIRGRHLECEDGVNGRPVSRWALIFLTSQIIIGIHLMVTCRAYFPSR